jgi:energy-coupling factor transport system permease protein
VSTFLAERDATAKLAAATVWTGALFATLNPVTSLIALGFELLLAPLAGLPYGTLLRRGWPLLLSAAGLFGGTVLFAADRGAAVPGATAYALRLIAIGLPGLLAFVSTDPTDLADSLMAHLKVPSRWAIGALAAFRLLPLLIDEWRQLTYARRARGLDAGWNPVARARLFASTTFALLVGAIRRGIRLATAMEARGFDAGGPRTSARVTHFGPRDLLVIVGGVLIAAICLLGGHLLH